MTNKRTTKEEKYSLLLSLFKETEDVYQLKELERVAKEKKGLNSNIIKETLQRLVDDDQVQEGKVGAQTYYWRFESKATQDKKAELDALTEKLNQKKEYLKELEEKLTKIDPADFEDTDDLIKQNEELRTKIKKAEWQIDELSKSDQTEELLMEANNWTDNIFLIKSYITKLGMDVKELDKQFNIPGDLDYM